MINNRNNPKINRWIITTVIFFSLTLIFKSNKKLLHLKYCNKYFKPYLYASDKESFPIALNGKKHK